MPATVIRGLIQRAGPGHGRGAVPARARMGVACAEGRGPRPQITRAPLSTQPQGDTERLPGAHFRKRNGLPQSRGPAIQDGRAAESDRVLAAHRL